MEIKYIDRRTGNILIENPPKERLLKFLYHHPFGRTAILPLVKQKFLSEFYGRKMNKLSSKNRIKNFVSLLDIDMTEAQKSINEFRTFNDFIYRELKPQMRVIQDGFVSPGDGKLIAFKNISEIKNFYIKGQAFTIADFLNNKAFENIENDYSLLILRLAPNDYHRFHFPYNGLPSKPTQIKGHYLSVSPYALVKDFCKVFCENKREYTTLSTSEKGNIIIVSVGATMMGSITNTYIPGQKVTKGQEMGYFSFGGSTIAMIIDKDKVKIDADILENTKMGFETFVRMGEKIAE